MNTLKRNVFKPKRIAKQTRLSKPIHGKRKSAKYMSVRGVSLLQAIFPMVDSGFVTSAKLRAP
jgi:hypothetical protein